MKTLLELRKGDAPSSIFYTATYSARFVFGEIPRNVSSNHPIYKNLPHPELMKKYKEMICSGVFNVDF